MSGIRGKDTRPELIIRKGLHRLGYRFRIHVKDLPGKPDLVFPKYRAVIFVHGCFWHGHDCHLFKWPKTREEFWKKKIDGNRERDLEAIQVLRDRSWRVLTVWECALKGKHRLPFNEITQFASDWLRSDISCAELRGLDTGETVIGKRTAGVKKP